MQTSSAIPLLRIFSETKAKEFYIDFLGFSVDWEHRFEKIFRCIFKPVGATLLFI